MSTDFVKIEALGNDFAIFHHNPEVDWSALASAIVDRHCGIGADGLITVEKLAAARAEIRWYNSDGSWMGMCGNGLRCVVRFLCLEGLIDSEQGEVTIQAGDHSVPCTYSKSGREVEAALAQPTFNPDLIPLSSQHEIIQQELNFGARTYNCSVLSVGNPHCIAFVEQLDRAELLEVGPLVENHELFPERTNFELVQVKNRERLELLVWERGVGETMACGSGACAAMVAAAQAGLVERQCVVRVPGGELQVRWPEQSNTVYLRGPAREVYRGQCSLEDFVS